MGTFLPTSLMTIYIDDDDDHDHARGGDDYDDDDDHARGGDDDDADVDLNAIKPPSPPFIVPDSISRTRQEFQMIKPLLFLATNFLLFHLFFSLKFCILSKSQRLVEQFKRLLLSVTPSLPLSQSSSSLPPPTSSTI